jgi:alkaline phosphatase D
MDSLIGYFRDQLHKVDFGKKVNIIVVSDHGMAEVDTSHNIFIDKDILEKLVNRIEGGHQSVYIDVKAGQENKLHNYISQFKHIKTFTRSEFPKNWHINDSLTVPNLILLADEGYNIHMEGKKQYYIMKSKTPPSSGKMNMDNKKTAKTGSHGYNNDIQSMQTIFYACGPSFKTMYTQKPFENVDVFPLICKVFNVTTPDIDGKIKDVDGMLVSK